MYPLGMFIARSGHRKGDRMADHKLTTKGIEKLIRDKDVGKHADGGGLYLQITEAGGAYWRYKYRLGGKEGLFAIGTFADYKLAEARVEHEKARKQVLAGDHPADARKAMKAEKEVARQGRKTFREVAKEWRDTMTNTAVENSTLLRHNKNISRLDAGFGGKDITTVTVADLASVLNKIQAAGSYSMRERTQHLAVKIMGFAVGKGYVAHNVLLNVRFADAFISPGETYEPRPAIVEAEPFGKLLRDIERAPAADCDDVCRIGLRLLTLLAVRPGELVKAEWAHIDWRASKLVVPFAVLKQRTERKRKKDPRAGKNFEVPLSQQAVAELRALKKLTGDHTHLFPAYSVRRHKHPHMRASQFNNILRRIGYEGTHCGHGFRSTFSTVMNAERVQVGERKVLRWPYQDALIEVQLDHNDASTKAVYDRGGHWEDRVELMQAWADQVDAMRGQRTGNLRLVA